MAADRGFIFKYNPQDKTRVLINSVRSILSHYSDDLPLNLRQVFYALIVDHGYEKTEQAYKRLSGHVAKARRAGWIPWNAIRDDGFHSGEALTYSDADDVCEHFANQAARVRVDRQFGQDRKISVWCEAQGMVPSIEKICSEYGVEVLSSGGFDSVTAKHDVAQRYARSKQEILVLHIGDYDPSGETMFKVLEQDVGQFVIDITAGMKQPPTFERLALTQEQVRRFDLPTAPPKKSGHSKNWVGGTVQLEALDPKTLRGMVKEAIEAELDMDQYNRMLATEQEIRKEVKQRLGTE
jgi:hypothetical protein